MTIRRGIVLGFASCGVFTGGGGLHHVRALESLKTAEPNCRHPSGAGCLTTSTRIDHATTRVVTSGVLASAVMATMLGAGAHMHGWSSLRHVGTLLTGRVLRLAARDPLLVGSGLCVLVVVAVVVLVTAVIERAEGGSRPYPRLLVGGLARRVHGGGAPRAAGQQLRGVRLLRSVPRRPPTMQSTRPGNRPLALSPVPGRTTR